MSSSENMTKNERKDHVELVWETMKPNSPIYSFLLGSIVISSVEEGNIKAQLDVQPVHVNSKGVLHGTVSACLVDWAGSMVVASYGREKTGLSTDLHVTFIAGAKLGDLLEIEGKASKVGGTLAFTTVTISTLGIEKENKKLVATGSHTKFVQVRPQ